MILLGKPGKVWSNYKLNKDALLQHLNDKMFGNNTKIYSRI
jgi:hypothetical protein